MDQSKEELLGSIQRMNSRAKQERAALKGQREMLKEIDDELPAKAEMEELADKVEKARGRLEEQRAKSEKWRVQNENVQDAKAQLETTEDALSETLILYMVKTKSKAVHAVEDDEESVDREIVTRARVGKKVPANLSLFNEDDMLDEPGGGKK